MLAWCDHLWGGDAVLADAGVEVHRDVLFAPFDPHLSHQADERWGVFDSSGRLIESAAFRRGRERHLVGQSLQRTAVPGEAVDAPDGCYIYGGVLIYHYGHFILSALSRLWGLSGARPPGVKVLFHTHQRVDELMSIPYMRACFDRLGLGERDIAVLDRPSRVAQLIVPGASLEEQSFVTPQFRETCHRIGRAFVVPEAQAVERDPIYLSKTGLTGGVSRFTNEAVVEAVFRANGFEVVHPERLGFAEQVRLFSERRTIVGPVCSAFHTSIFSPPRSRLLCLCPNRSVHSNYTLVDKANGNQVGYVCPAEDASVISNDGAFLTSFVLGDPELTAYALLAMALRGPPWDLPGRRRTPASLAAEVVEGMTARRIARRSDQLRRFAAGFCEGMKRRGE